MSTAVKAGVTMRRQRASGEAAGPGPIDSLGPQDGAPGLNNDHGGEIVATAIGPTRCGMPPS